jgi:hypothetical protein
MAAASCLSATRGGRVCAFRPIAEQTHAAGGGFPDAPGHTPEPGPLSPTPIVLPLNCLGVGQIAVEAFTLCHAIHC